MISFPFCQKVMIFLKDENKGDEAKRRLKWKIKQPIGIFYAFL